MSLEPKDIAVLWLHENAIVNQKTAYYFASVAVLAWPVVFSAHNNLVLLASGLSLLGAVFSALSVSSISRTAAYRDHWRTELASRSKEYYDLFARVKFKGWARLQSNKVLVALPAIGFLVWIGVLAYFLLLVAGNPSPAGVRSTPMTFDVFTALQTFAQLAIVATFFVYYFQLRAMQKQVNMMQSQLHNQEDVARGQNFFTLINFLQDSALRDARAAVLEELSMKSYPDEWTDDDRKQASRVCSSYDAALIAYEKGWIDRKMFEENYGPSIRNCYRVLKDFVEDQQKHRGTDYWDEFQRFGEKTT